MIQDSISAPTGISLISFIGNCTIYNRYFPWFETQIKPLRILHRSYCHSKIPLVAWPPWYILLFNIYKSKLVSSPSLLHYNSFKLVFLKTDWSASGMGYILMQLDNSPESLIVIKYLSKTEDCGFK